jgi:glycyl-tRNA synthetase beta chain
MKKIIYHEKIGSMWDKTQRVIKLSNYIAGEALNQKPIIPVVERIAELSKADLTTHMVGEFGSLAGIMGREYSLVAGEDPRVARGIFEHYLPRFSKDVLPEDIPGAVVGLADRLDSLVGCFSSGIIPTGSQDPYGLRRAAQGIVSLIIGKNMELSISKLIDKSMETQGVQDAEARGKLLDFIRQRVKAVLESENVRYDVADAVMKDSDFFVESYCKAFEIMKVLDEPWFKGLVRTSDRIERICSGARLDHVATEDFIEEGEKSLFKAYCQVQDIVAEQLSQKKYNAALRALQQLTEPADIFFEKILVMHEDKKIRANRLALLKSLENLYLKFADFPKIVI